MFPILFEIGPIKLRVYGLMLALAFLLGSWIALKRGRKTGLDDETLLNLFWWVLFSSILGARLYFVLANPDLFERPLDAFKIWEGGMILQGGVIGAVTATWFYARRHRLSFLALTDIAAPSTALGEAIGRIGCFFNGCCFGTACTSPPGIHYPSSSFPSRVLGDGVASFPSPLLLAILLTGLFALLMAYGRRARAPGAIFAGFLIGDGLIRYGVDFTRYYESTDQIVRFAPYLVTRSQGVALGTILLGLALWIWSRRNSRKMT